MDPPAGPSPPVVFSGAVGAMVALAIFAPGPRLLAGTWRAGGLALVATGVGIHWWAWRLFRRRNTPVRADEPPRALVTDGPYRFFRNPMYLGGVLILLGGAVLIGTTTPVLVAVAYAVVADRVFVRREERTMEARFGKEYRAYRARVRRWV